MSGDNVLFLDDMEWRHREFGRIAIQRFPDVRIYPAWSAEEAIELLGRIEFVQAFLDHDLSLDDIMVVPGGPSKVLTGMAVVDHLVAMEDPPRDIVCHSCNGPARLTMVNKLEESGKFTRVRALPFPELMQLLNL